MACAAVLAVAAIRTAHAQQQVPPLTVEVTTKARAMRPGEVVLLTIRPSRAVAVVEGSAFDAPIRPWTSTITNQWNALIGVPLTIIPGRHQVTLHAKAADGETVSTHVTLPIERGQFGTRRLTVDPQFVNPPASVQDRIAAEAKTMAAIFADGSPARLWRGKFRLPVPGKATSSFGRLSILNGESRSRHQGADFTAAEGTLVRAPNAGRIALAADYYFSGNTVIVDHGAGLFSLFAHFSKTRVTLGASVAAGDLLGESGATGRVTGPHLHWAVRLNGASVDPLSLVAATALSE
jgi:murein DD-endopeptidase MepM/ murein hydrolase activator NlpD